VLGGTSEKLARFDQILAAAGPRGASTLSVVYLDGAQADRVTVRLAAGGPEPVQPSIVASKKFRPEKKRGED